MMTFEPPPSPPDEVPPSETPELPDEVVLPELLELLVLLPSSPEAPPSLLLLELLRHALIARAQSPATVTENLMRNIGLVTDAPLRKKESKATVPRSNEVHRRSQLT
jgi:hypothetical protein